MHTDQTLEHVASIDRVPNLVPSPAGTLCVLEERAAGELVVIADRQSQHRLLLQKFDAGVKAPALERIATGSLPQLVCAWENRGVRYVLMELVSGTSLTSILDQRAGELSLAALRVATALVCQSAGVVHQITGMYAPGARPAFAHRIVDSLVITDAGTVRARTLGARLDATPSARTRPALAAARFVAPEQLRGWPLDRTADVFALGSVLFQLVTGRPAFRGKTYFETLRAMFGAPPDPRELRLDCPDSIAAVITRCLDPNPGARFGSAVELASAIFEAMRPCGRLASFDEIRDALAQGVGAGASLAGDDTVVSSALPPSCNPR